ncbi:hypothetical protein MM221_21130 [Salipaludibacillus sp. LMS25]|uniref:hypothetical protein n=1 Tax=Salipaludibacillus sp. LMS25 TaxID=2924031 RepID=UPI0020D06A71|nr:hypothetical protein [Salipaludibacillus sp. LMS25]UTR15001.1 hypothetical protein MM221_21130 [Salipaludibacillus sp. LMS25]
MRKELIRRKISLMNAKKSMEELTYLELIDFEKNGSPWLELLGSKLKEFRKIDSTPTYTKPMGEDEDNIILWIKESLCFFSEKKNLFISVPKCSDPVWANVKVVDFTKAIEELWHISELDDFLIVDKTTGKIAQIFCEEKDYEIHIGMCDITRFKK